jgi:3alpha(or 20beta)-hydroxysteroid dehydrogenase
LGVAASLRYNRGTMKILKGKIAIVTGAARGTGEVVARLFAQDGATVVLGDLLEPEGSSVAAEIGDHAVFERLDVTDSASWQDVVARTVERFGRVDILVNNAAILEFSGIDELSQAKFEQVLRVNLVGPFLGMQAVTEAMKTAGGGSIVNVASTDGVKGRNGIAAYASSKWGLRGLTRVAALELGRFGIRVNAVCPEAGSTQMVGPYIPEGIDPELALSFAHGRLASQSERSHADRMGDVAKMIRFLASNDSASCTGADFLVDSACTAGDITPGLPGS